MASPLSDKDLGQSEHVADAADNGLTDTTESGGSDAHSVGTSVGTDRWYTYILLAVGTDRVKIGKTQDFPRRLRDLQAANACQLVPLRVIDSDAESYLHAEFGEYRLHGEWFWLSPELREYVEEFPLCPAVHRLDELLALAVRRALPLPKKAVQP